MFFHYDAFSCVFRLSILSISTQKSTAMVNKLSSIFGIEILATQANSKSGEMFRK